MNIIKTICTATAVLLAGMLTSCSDYLDVSKELAKNLDKEEVFSKAKYILKSATKPLNVLIAFTRPLITEFADNLNLKHPLLPTISPYPTM